MKEHPYSSFIHQVEKPARYIGGEYNTIIKDWKQIDTKMVLCFPDLYDIGMSHLGTKILYSLINKTDDLYLERAFCPWSDMEAALKEQKLHLLSLETHQPLKDFDVVGFSLQYELTFTNIFTMLDLGGIPLHNEDRTLDHPLVIAGGPVATQPEPLAPFIDIFLIGDAEERLPRLLRHYGEMKRAGKLSRTEILIELVKEGGLYCPDLYEREICERSDLMYVSKPKYDGVPETVKRTFIEDLNRYSFPNDSPVAAAEAIFDRMAIEIARGCTEGCRFCQAGMIYRPVRERNPEEVVETVLSAIKNGGYDEAAITSLSTADYSCISPLVKNIMERLRAEKVSLGISSLRAYGLDEPLLDEIESVKATGLTFAPEAGTQRMRDVINKNITDEDIFTTCHRVFSRSWNRVKLYFMIGLPTETDEDVLGIAQLGRQALQIAKLHHPRKARVVVSVSSHIPKPHTPFQWCAMDTQEQTKDKQDLLYNLARKWGYKLRTHNHKVSHLEGITARGDYRTASLLEDAWRGGARFDGWDEKLEWDVWSEALEKWEEREGVSRNIFLQTLPTDARLPWDHIDVGLEEGFLLKEYTKSLKSRLSPPCGKPFKAQVHHTNLQDAEAEKRKLICYHCGIACDMKQMKQERIDYLKLLKAFEPPEPKEGNRVANAHERVKKGKTPHDFQQGDPIRYRLRYSKLAPVSLQGHHDLLRIMPRIFRRAEISVYYSEGFSPRPSISFGPALTLGIQSLAEHIDVKLTVDLTADELLTKLNTFAPNGMFFTAARRLGSEDRALSKTLKGMNYLITIPEEKLVEVLKPLQEKYFGTEAEVLLAQRCLEVKKQTEFPIRVTRKHKTKALELWDRLMQIEVAHSNELPEGIGIPDDRIAIKLRIEHDNGAAIRPAEIFKAIFDVDIAHHHIIRLGCWSYNQAAEFCDPIDEDKSGVFLDMKKISVQEADALHRGNMVQLQTSPIVNESVVKESIAVIDSPA